MLEAKQKEYEMKGTPFNLEIYVLDKACEYCFTSLSCKYLVITRYVDAVDVGEIQDVLGKKTGARTVPRIFFAGESLGGNDNLVAAMKPAAEKPLDDYWLKKAVQHTAARSS